MMPPCGQKRFRRFYAFGRIKRATKVKNDVYIIFTNSYAEICEEGLVSTGR